MGGQAFRLRAGHGAPTPWRAGLFGGQDGPADGALAGRLAGPLRQDRLDESWRRPLARGAWPACWAPGPSRARAGARGAWRGSSRDDPEAPAQAAAHPVARARGERAAAGDAAGPPRQPATRYSCQRDSSLPSAAQWGWPPWRQARALPAVARRHDAPCQARAPATPLELPALGTGRRAAPGFTNTSRAPLPRPLESSAPRKGGDDARRRRRSARSRRRGRLGEHPRGAASGSGGPNVRRGTERRFASML